MKEIRSCPVCASETLNVFLVVRDFFLSGEEFPISECASCGFRFTNPRPDTENLSAYYESEAYISHSSIKAGLVNRIYLAARTYTVHTKYKLVSRMSGVQKGSILDIGCGTGELLSVFRKNGWETCGIEPNAAARKEAIRRHAADVFESAHLKILPSGHYHVISLWHVMEHLENLDDTLNEIRRLLKPEGTLIVAVPNCNSLDAKIYGKFWAAYDVPRHLYHFTQDSMNKLFTKHNVKLLRVIPMKLDAFYVSLLSEKYKNGKPRYMKAVWTGLKSNCYAARHHNEYSSLIFAGKIK